MSMSFFPTPEFEVAVDDPGYGYVYACGYGWDWRRIGGGDLGRFLEAVTALALGLPPQGRGLPPEMTREDAAEVLPSLQRAVLLAGAGTDRFDIITGSEDAVEQLCVYCDEGTDYTRPGRDSTWCEEHGHAPFGARWDGRRWKFAELEVS